MRLSYYLRIIKSDCKKVIGLVSILCILNNLIVKLSAIFFQQHRAYACQLCDKRFGQKYHLAIHVSAVHEGTDDQS